MTAQLFRRFTPAGVPHGRSRQPHLLHRRVGATKVGISTSIGSEPDNAWVAARQSQITADQQASKGAAQTNRMGNAEQALLSGESERIGTRNFDKDTPFGKRVAII